MKLAISAHLWLVASFLLLGIPLFLAAGTLAWIAGWSFLILLHGWMLIGIWLLLRFNPGLLAERINPSQAQQKSWDKVFLGVFYILFFAMLILMPLDVVRFHWSSMPWWLQVVGAMLLIGGFVIISLTFRENSFLSPTVRIQEERQQTTISTGPYHYVRHPMYAGGIPLFLGTPLLLGSWYGVGLFLLLLPAVVVRATLEERTLRAELPGYAAYMAEVKYRLIPHIW